MNEQIKVFWSARYMFMSLLMGVWGMTFDIWQIRDSIGMFALLLFAGGYTVFVVESLNKNRNEKRKGNLKDDRIQNVILMPNGMVAVFDEADEQIPELQGMFLEVNWPGIVKRSDAETNFLMGTVEMDLEWYFEKYHSGKNRNGGEEQDEKK
jgi:hypothetical protein